jgi:hypothetical protein
MRIGRNLQLLNRLLLASLGDKFDCSRLVADSFVDDTTRWATSDDPDIEPAGVEVQQLTESEEKLVTRVQDIVHFFMDILQVTGRPGTG